MPRNAIGSEARTKPWIWCVAIICTVLAIVVIISGIVIFVGYLFFRPKIPSVTIVYAHLDRFNYDQASILNTHLTIVIRAQNDNVRASARFSTFHYSLVFNDIPVAHLVNKPFHIGENSSVDFNYQVESNHIPLDPNQMDRIQRSLQRNRAEFDLKGHTRTRWRVGPFVSLKYWINLGCNLQFRIYNNDGSIDGSSVSTRCISKPL